LGHSAVNSGNTDRQFINGLSQPHPRCALSLFRRLPLKHEEAWEGTCDFTNTG
jgi:hypothetical protein